MTPRDKAALPMGWERRPLVDIAQVNPPLGRQVSGDEFPVTFVPMRAVRVEGGGITNPEIRPYGDVKKGYTAFLSGDVIMAKITPCMENGKTTAVPEVPGSICFGSTEFHVVRPEPGIASKWIEQFLLQNEIRRDAQRRMGGAVGQMRVPAEFLNSFRIPVAPSTEQVRIAEALDELFSHLDAGVAALERARDRLTRYRASVLKAAVEGAQTADWRAVHPNVEPAGELLKRVLAERHRRWEEYQLRKFAENGKPPPKNWRSKYKEPVAPDTGDLPSLPKGWCWATMGQLAWASGYGTSVKCSKDNSGLPVLRIPNIIGDQVNLDDLKFAPSNYEERDDDLLMDGDLLIVRTNGSRNLIGRGALICGAQERLLSFASYLIRIRLVRDRALLGWVALLWASFHVRAWIEAHAATSAGQYNISLRVLYPLVVPIAPSEEQEAIIQSVDEQLSVIDRLESDIDAKLKAAHGLRQAILRQAFAGRLVPQDPNDEPASELLKRIADERQVRTQKAAAAKRATQNKDGGRVGPRRRPRKTTAEATS